MLSMSTSLAIRDNSEGILAIGADWQNYDGIIESKCEKLFILVDTQWVNSDVMNKVYMFQKANIGYAPHFDRYDALISSGADQVAIRELQEASNIQLVSALIGSRLRGVVHVDDLDGSITCADRHLVVGEDS